MALYLVFFVPGHNPPRFVVSLENVDCQITANSIENILFIFTLPHKMTIIERKYTHRPFFRKQIHEMLQFPPIKVYFKED